MKKIFDLRNKIIAITGASGSIGSELSCSLAEMGCKVVLLYNSTKPKNVVLERLEKSFSDYEIYRCNVTVSEEMENCREFIIDKFGSIDALINCAGGNNPSASTSKENSFFKISKESYQWVTDLNLLGTIIPCQVFGQIFAEQKKGNIVNISSMAAFRPLTKIPAYSSSKAAINSFTRWLSVHMAKEYSSNIRVNAIAPGFILSKQNRFLLVDKSTGNYTKRGKSIIENTPMGKFGEPKELLSTVVWLLSDYSNFVTGTIVPVDGGFDAYSGV